MTFTVSRRLEHLVLHTERCPHAATAPFSADVESFTVAVAQLTSIARQLHLRPAACAACCRGQ